MKSMDNTKSYQISLSIKETKNKNISPLNIIFSFFNLFFISISLNLFLSQFSITLRSNLLLSSLFIVGWILISFILQIRLKINKKTILFNYTIVFLLIYLITFYWTKNGFIQIFNESIAQIGRFRGHYFFGFDGGAQKNLIIVLLILAQILVILSLLIEQHFYLGISLAWILMTLSGGYFLKTFNAYVLICLLLATLTGILSKFTFTAKNYKTSLIILFSLISLTLIPSFLLKINEINESSLKVEKLKQSLTYKKEAKKYGVDPFLPMGQLENYQENRTDRDVLRIEMADQEPIYLKQFVGKTFTNNSWNSLTNDSLYDDYPLNYWLEKNGFSSFTQFSNLKQATNQENNINKVKITNLNGSTKQLFIPYGITLAKGLDFKITNDSYILAKSNNEKSYTFDVLKNSIVDYPSFVKNYSDLKSKNSRDNYLINEANYNEFVYKNYLDLPEDLLYLLVNATEVEPKLKEHVYYEEADKIVNEFIEAIYKQPTPKRKISPNFIKNSLTKKDSVGFDIEIATLSTLLYRHMGIPARYVEGYLVTNDSIENATGKSINISGKSAHAWVEIYQDGVGWVPKESDPSYINVMPQPTFEGLSHDGHGDKDGNDTGKSPNETIEELLESPTSETKKELDKKKTNYTFYLKKIIMIIFLSILLVVTIYYLTNCYKAFQKRKSIKNRIAGKDTLKSSQEKLSEVYRLLSLNNIVLEGGSLYDYIPLISEQYKDRKYTKLYKKVIDDIQRATYSTNQSLSKNQIRRVNKLLKLTKHNVFSDNSLKEKIKLRYRLFFL